MGQDGKPRTFGLVVCGLTDWALLFLHNTLVEPGVIISILQMSAWTQRGQVHVIH